MENRCELALPAGSLQCALYAFKGGADAVYFGLKSFSARKAAVNFSFEDVRKLKALCSEGGQYEGKKFYVTVNTLASDSQLDDVIKLLRQLSYLKPDGLIVQDLGIAKIIREHFPSLPLHGSTQLAVHTIDGVKELQSLGFSRVVLSRELSFEEIKKIRLACPDIELKVFIHGALCYGFSGACMASQVITGDRNKSANRGSCAQICRTWFHCKETGKDSWLFSMKDLCLGELVRQYQEIGIEPLKIEGRMKGADYAYWCARYYSMILEGKTEKDPEVIWAKDAMQIAFSRDTTDYFFHTGTNGCIAQPNMVSSHDTGHRGIQVGTIDKVLSGKAVVRFTKPVAIRDGLKVISASSTKISESIGFALTFIESSRSDGRKDSTKSFISEGEMATINFPSDKFEKKPGFGTPVYCVSRHNLNLPLLNENLPLYKDKLDIEVAIDKDGFSINGEKTSLEIQQAKGETDIKEIFTKALSASDKSYFTLGNLNIRNNSPYENPFIPLSVLKQARRDFYEKLDTAFENSLEEKIKITKSEKASVRCKTLPPRQRLGLWDMTVDFCGTSFLPLSPVMFDEESYLKKVEEKLEAAFEKKIDIIVGLNNIAQVYWAKNWVKKNALSRKTRFFADVFLYTENSTAFESLKEELPNLIGSYELDDDTPFNYTGSDYEPPVFISRVCLRHNGLGMDCKNCTRNNIFHLQQNGNSYEAICRNCITVVVRE